jgi:GT2 family glycosyltransferase
LDDDVIPAPDAIEMLVSALDSADGVGAGILPLDTGSVVAHYMHVDGLVNHRVMDGKVHWLITAAAAFRREALERVGGFDPEFPRAAGEDVDLSLRLLENHCRLRLESAAVVKHDHRSRFADLLRTCHRYGSAYKRLASRHDVHRREIRRAALWRLNPIEWVRVYCAYREHASIRRALAFLVFHAIVVVPYAVGRVSGPAPSARQRTVPEDVQLVGRSQAYPTAAGESAPRPKLVAAERDPAA